MDFLECPTTSSCSWHCFCRFCLSLPPTPDFKNSHFPKYANGIEEKSYYNCKFKKMEQRFVKISLFYIFKALHQNPFLLNLYSLFFLIILLPYTSSIATEKYSKKYSRPDMLCNIGGKHECVCNRSLGDLDFKYKPCDIFLEHPFGSNVMLSWKIPLYFRRQQNSSNLLEKKLTVVNIKMKNVNFNARLYTNESYQQYFRRRIANIMSKYCEEHPNECIDTIAFERANPKTNLKTTNNEKLATKALLIDRDEEEASFTQENVILLKVIFGEKNRTDVLFVVTKKVQNNLLNSIVIMEPAKIKYIMSSQLAPLSRVLGGIRIEELNLIEMRKRRIPYSENNTKLIIFVGGILCALTICYFIAIFTLIRECRAKKAEQNKSKRLSEKTKSTRNYGTCTDKLLPSYETANGKPKSKSITSKESINLRKKKSNTSDFAIINELSNNSEMDMESADLPVHYQNIFSCDHAQLPEESLIQENDLEFSNNYSTKIQINPEFYSTIKDGLFETPDNLVIEEEIPETTHNPPIPHVILNSSSSSQNDIKKDSENAGVRLLGAPTEFNPYKRPLSRRGSRNSTQEEGIEEGEDSRTETPKPLGDQLDQLTNKQRDTRTYNLKQTWSSESDEESDEIEIYHPLENDNLSDNERKLKNHNNNKLTNNNVKPPNKRFPTFKSGETSDTEDDELDINAETNMLERHNYQRLQESPLPPSNMEY